MEIRQLTINKKMIYYKPMKTLQQNLHKQNIRFHKQNLKQ